MIRYVLDTNVLVDVLRNRPKGVRERLLEIGIDKCVVSDLTVFELYSGVASSSNPEQNKEFLEKMFEKLAVIPASDAYWLAAQEKARLTKAGTPIEDFDLLIGCTALEYGLTLITGNVKHMGRLEGLNIEPWV